jgi:hypothetical protein
MSESAPGTYLAEPSRLVQLPVANVDCAGIGCRAGWEVVRTVLLFEPHAKDTEIAEMAAAVPISAGARRGPPA